MELVNPPPGGLSVSASLSGSLLFTWIRDFAIDPYFSIYIHKDQLSSSWFLQLALHSNSPPPLSSISVTSQLNVCCGPCRGMDGTRSLVWCLERYRKMPGALLQSPLARDAGLCPGHFPSFSWVSYCFPSNQPKENFETTLEVALLTGSL